MNIFYISFKIKNEFNYVIYGTALVSMHIKVINDRGEGILYIL